MSRYKMKKCFPVFKVSPNAQPFGLEDVKRAEDDVY